MPHLADNKVRSLECSGRVVLDRNCNLSTPKAEFDNYLKVDVGGDVVMMATTINMRNATIDFDGATLQNFTGDISGNISGTINVDIVNALVVNAYNKITGNLYGNVFGGYIEGEHFGTFCGNLSTNSISKKSGSAINIVDKVVITDNLTVTGVTALNGVLNVTGTTNSTVFVGPLSGNVVGNVIGGIVTNSIKEKITNVGIGIEGNLTLVNDDTRLIGNVCGSIQTDLIESKTGNIVITGNIKADKINAGTICGNFIGNFIGNVEITGMIGNFYGNLYGDVYGGNINGNFIGNLLVSDFDAQTVNANVINVAYGLCGNIITDSIEKKAGSYISVKDDMYSMGNIIAGGPTSLLVGTTIKATNGISGGSGILSVTDGLNVMGPSTSITTTSTSITSATTITSSPLNVIGTTAITGGLTTTTSVTATGGLFGTHNGAVNTNLISNLIAGNIVMDGNVNINGVLSVSNIAGMSPVTVNDDLVCLKQALFGDSLSVNSGNINVSSGDINVSSGVINIGGNNVVTTRQTAISNSNYITVTDTGPSSNVNLTELNSALTEIQNTVNYILAALRTHGLIDV